ncbi:MAG TPA: MFS transporter [Burkholderiaceae bacterium]|nr:MFS transporter [Burkholderiaceae bacterium]
MPIHKPSGDDRKSSISASPSFSWRTIFISAFGPSILFGLGQGAILPVIALAATALGASHAISGLIVGLIGLGLLLNNIPAALLIGRFGERRALVGTAVFSIVGLFLCLRAPNLLVLGTGVLMQGMSLSVFNLARQTYLMQAVPVSLRGRAFSIMGGTQRIGVFAGPFIAAGAISYVGLSGAWWTSIVALIFTGVLCQSVPDLPSHRSTQNDTSSESPSDVPDDKMGLASMWASTRTHYRILLTLGLAVMILTALRAARPITVPLWAEHIGISPAVTVLIFGFASAIDMLVFYPAGKIMDEYGRLWIAIPCVLLLGLSFMLMPATHSVAAFVATAALMGLGNGIGSGIIMTLGADVSPRAGRISFLGIWRVVADSGQTLGPLFMSAITAILSLGASLFMVGTLGVVSAWIFIRQRLRLQKHQ